MSLTFTIPNVTIEALESKAAELLKLADQLRAIAQNTIKATTWDEERAWNIVEVVADLYRVRLVDITSKRRQQHIAHARQCAYYMIREITEMSFPVIARMFQADHSTVIHGCNMIKRRMEEPAFASMIAKLRRQIEEKISPFPVAVEQPSETAQAAA